MSGSATATRPIRRHSGHRVSEKHPSINKDTRFLVFVTRNRDFFQKNPKNFCRQRRKLSRNDFNGAIDEKCCISKEREKKRRIELAPLRQHLKAGVEAGDDQRDGGTDRFRRDEPFNQRRDGGDPADRDRKDEYSRQSCDKDRIQRVQKPDRGAKFPIPPHFPALQAFTNRGFTVSVYAKARLYRTAPKSALFPSILHCFLYFNAFSPNLQSACRCFAERQDEPLYTRIC